MSVMVPSVVIAMAMVEWSFITLLVPVRAAAASGIGLSDQGVLTILGSSSSNMPSAPSIMYPTQSISLILNLRLSPAFISAGLEGTNLGSVVVIILPAPIRGSSSVALFFSNSSVILGRTAFSINLLINVDLPVLQGPVMPMYMAPPVLSEMS